MKKVVEIKSKYGNIRFVKTEFEKIYVSASDITKILCYNYITKTLEKFNISSLIFEVLDKGNRARKTKFISLDSLPTLINNSTSKNKVEFEIWFKKIVYKLVDNFEVPEEIRDTDTYETEVSESNLEQKSNAENSNTDKFEDKSNTNKVDDRITVYSNPEFGNIRTIEIDGEPWFIGKDVAEMLGYTNPRKAIRDHIDIEDRMTEQIVSSGQNRELYIINESGLYSLIISSKLDSARRFKHWVTKEVLPSIRRNGGYSLKKENIPQEKSQKLDEFSKNSSNDNVVVNLAIDIAIETLTNLRQRNNLGANYQNKFSSSLSEIEKKSSLIANISASPTTKQEKTPAYPIGISEIYRNDTYNTTPKYTGKTINTMQGSASIEVFSRCLRKQGIDTGKLRISKALRKDRIFEYKNGDWNYPTKKAWDNNLVEWGFVEEARENGTIDKVNRALLTIEGQKYFIQNILGGRANESKE